jgi:chromosome segregation ATPase
LAEKTSESDILKVEKRVIDLELGIAELKATRKAIDIKAISDLKKKVEDLEDMVLVEDAGMIEIKRILDSIQSKIAEVEISPELREKVSRLETEIISLTKKAPPTAVEMETLHGKITEMAEELSTFKIRLEEGLKAIEEKIRTMEEKQALIKPPGVDFDLLSSKIEALRGSMDELSKKRIEMDLRIAEIAKKFEIMEKRMRESLSEKVLDEIRINKKEIIGTNARIDSIERVTRDLISSLRNVETSIKKFESLEKASMLSKEIEEKIERFKFIEDETKRLSSRIEKIYDSIDRRLDKMKSMEKKFPEIAGLVKGMMKEMERIRTQVLEREKKEDVKRKFREFEEKMLLPLKSQIETLNDRIIALRDLKFSIEKRLTELAESEIRPIKERIVSVENEYKKLSDMKEAVGNVFKKIDEMQKGLNKRFGMIEERMKKSVKIEDVEKRINEIESKLLLEVKSRLDSINKTITSIKVAPELQKAVKNISSEMNEYRKEIDLLEKRLKTIEDIEKNIKKLSADIEKYEKRSKEIEKKIVLLKPEVLGKMVEEIKSTYESRMASLEANYKKTMDEMKALIEKRVTEVSMPRLMEVVESRVKELVERIVFLESRLKAIEQMLSKPTKPTPIVLE